MEHCSFFGYICVPTGYLLFKLHIRYIEHSRHKWCKFDCDRLCLKYNNWHTTARCVILPDITNMTPAMQLHVSDWSIPKDLQLADEASISLLPSISSVGQTYSMTFYAPAERQDQEITLCCRKLHWDEQFLVRTVAVHSHSSHQTLLSRNNATLEKLQRSWELDSTRW